MEKSVENVHPDFKAIYTPIEIPNSVSDQGITNVISRVILLNEIK
jgi:hypothetical protein